MGSHYAGVPRRGRVARWCEAPGPRSPAPQGPSVTSSARLAVLGQAPQDLHDARLSSARVLGTPRVGRGDVSQTGGAADWPMRRWGRGGVLASLPGP